MASIYGRTVYLRQNVEGAWFLRISAHGNNERIAAEESFSSAGNAQRAFVEEARHQPCAALVVILEGRRPVTIRPPLKLPVFDRDVEQALLEKTRAAMRLL